MSLFTHLKEYRQLKSVSEKIPIYSVFGDTVMRSILQTKPLTQQALQTIRGFSQEKCQRYGDDIITMVKSMAHAPLPLVKPHIPPSSTGIIIVRHQQYRKPASSTRQGPMLSAAPYRKKSALAKKPFDVGQVLNTATKRIPGIPAGKEGVYILELAQGRVYVGQSADMRRRIQQHVSGQGSAFTKAFPPTGVILPRLGCVTGSAEAAERDETLRYMFLRGIQLVRGWKYTRVHMSETEEQDAEGNIREIFDLCRRCGHPGHFIGHCKANFDRLGKPCKH